jgi:hypothetical protein
MTNQTKSPVTAGNGPGLENFTRENDSTSEKPPLKWRRVLAAMAHGKSFNRFEVERELSDHCLHTTVSGLQARGIVIRRADEVVPGFAGMPTHVKRYTIAPESLERARELLNLTRESNEWQSHAIAS